MNSAALLFAAFLVAASFFAAWPAQALPKFEDVRSAHVPSDLPLWARDGTVLHWLRVDPQVRRGPWLALQDISPALRTALVLSEDRRFWAHGGVDWPALAASAWANAWNQRTRGASTLTMQLAGLLDDDLLRPAGGRSVPQKLTQMARAAALEAQWSKAQILEAYLNQVPLRGELVGVAAASLALLGKHAQGLDAPEAALLAAMVRAPNANAATLERRACEVLRQQSLGCEGLASTVAQALVRRPGPLHSAVGESLAPHLAQAFVRAGVVGAAWQSTLDARTQGVAVAALRRQLAELRGRQVEDGAVLVLDNRSGEVLAWVGSSGPGSSAAEVDAVLARRQPGSTLKPLVYALALQQRLITPATVLDDSPLHINAAGALYQPQNYDHRYRGAVHVRQALASSLNVPAVRVGSLLGTDAMFAGLNDAGLELRETAGWHGPALALGSADVSLLALTNAYRMLANGGRYSAVRWAASDVQSVNAASPPRRAKPSHGALERPVFSAAVAFLVADMLADPAARAGTFGLDSPLVTRGWAAVKTGTSKDMRDNWCIGFTDRYTVGVWVGNASGRPMHGVSGVSGAAPVWRELVAQLHAQGVQRLHPSGVSRAPSAPAGLVQQAGEWFLAGTERIDQNVSASAAMAAPLLAAPAHRIQSPRDGAVLVLDPDIPIAAQRLHFEAVGNAGRWWLNGRDLGPRPSLLWLPQPGRHRLEWRSAAGGEAVRVQFEVRATLGAAAPARRLKTSNG